MILPTILDEAVWKKVTKGVDWSKVGQRSRERTTGGNKDEKLSIGGYGLCKTNGRGMIEVEE